MELSLLWSLGFSAPLPDSVLRHLPGSSLAATVLLPFLVAESGQTLEGDARKEGLFFNLCLQWSCGCYLQPRTPGASGVPLEQWSPAMPPGVATFPLCSPGTCLLPL